MRIVRDIEKVMGSLATFTGAPQAVMAHRMPVALDQFERQVRTRIMPNAELIRQVDALDYWRTTIRREFWE